MSENVINIADFRKKRDGANARKTEWLFDLRAFGGPDGFEGTILSFNEAMTAGDGCRLRFYADCLDQLSWLLRQQAEKLEPSDDGMPLATALIFESSLVRVRVNDDEVTTSEQMAWLDDRFDDAKEASRPKNSGN